MAVNSEARALLDRQLERDERLLWHAQPIPSHHFRAHVGALFFAAIWNAFLVVFTDLFLVAGPEDGGLSWAFGGFLVPFWAVGIGVTATPWWARRKAKRLLYAITDRRVLLVDAGKSAQVRSLFVERLARIDLTIRKRDEGDITLANDVSVSTDGDSKTSIGFVGVPAVRDVERLLRETRAKKLAALA